MNKCFIGVDPGEKGGMACLFFREKGGCTERKIFTCKMPNDESGIVEWLEKVKYFSEFGIEVLIEEQHPRPTFFKDKTGKQTSSILRSSLIIYGNYRMICGILYALRLPPKMVLPKEWQKYYGLKREKGMSDSKWKNVLKAKSEEIFPDIGITLQTSDSLLLANYIYQTQRSNKG